MCALCVDLVPMVGPGPKPKPKRDGTLCDISDSAMMKAASKDVPAASLGPFCSGRQLL